MRGDALAVVGCRARRRWKWYSYIDFLKYSWGSLMVNQFENNDPKWLGSTVLGNYGLANVDKWCVGTHGGQPARGERVPQLVPQRVPQPSVEHQLGQHHGRCPQRPCSCNLQATCAASVLASNAEAGAGCVRAAQPHTRNAHAHAHYLRRHYRSDHR
jgi:hypothetical protein